MNLKNVSLIMLAGTLLLTTACSSNTGNPSTISTTAKKLNIVTSFYPLYDAVHEIAKDNANVINIVPASAEPHDYEPTPQDMISLMSADFVVYNGAGLEPWEDKVIPELNKAKIPTLKISDLFPTEIIKNDPTKMAENEELPYDPHVWLDPVNYKKIATAVEQKLTGLDPAHKTDYEKNARIFLEQLDTLNTAFASGLTKCAKTDFVTNHAAFSYLARRYHIHMIAIAGLSPDTEPSPKTMADVVNIIKQKNIHYVLTESLVSPKIADTIAQSTGAKTLVLSPLEGLTQDEMTQGKNYVSVMYDNLEVLKTALECHA